MLVYLVKKRYQFYRYTRHLSLSRQSSPIVENVQVKAAAIGSIAGLAGSLVGMGGAFISLPLMTGVLKMTQHTAHATSLAAVAACGAGGAVGYVASENVDWRAAAAISMSGIISARLGAKFAGSLDGAALKKLFGAFNIAIAPSVLSKLKVFKSEEVEARQTGKDSNPGVFHLMSMAGIGAITGGISGLFGVGGGSITVPGVALASDFSHYKVLGTSLGAMVVPAMAGVMTHHCAGRVVWRVAWPLAAGSALGCYIGGRYVAMRVEEDMLRLIFFGKK